MSEPSFGRFVWFDIHVDDVHTAAERIKANGGEVFRGPMVVPGGDWVAHARDPRGAAFAIHSVPSKG